MYWPPRYHYVSASASSSSLATDAIVPLMAPVEPSQSSESPANASSTTSEAALATLPPATAAAGLSGSRLIAAIAASLAGVVIVGVLSFFLIRHKLRARHRDGLTKDMSFLPRDGFGAASRSRPGSAGTTSPLVRSSGSRPSTAGGKPLQAQPDIRLPPTLFEKPSAVFLFPPDGSNATSRRGSNASTSDAGAPVSPSSAASHPFGALQSPKADKWVTSANSDRGHDRQPSYTHRRTMRLLRALADQDGPRPESQLDPTVPDAPPPNQPVKDTPVTPSPA